MFSGPGTLGDGRWDLHWTRGAQEVSPNPAAAADQSLAGPLLPARAPCSVLSSCPPPWLGPRQALTRWRGPSRGRARLSGGPWPRTAELFSGKQGDYAAGLRGLRYPLPAPAWR